MLTPGYYPSTYWPEDYWPEDYWPDYGFVVVSPVSIATIISLWGRIKKGAKNGRCNSNKHTC